MVKITGVQDLLFNDFSMYKVEEVADILKIKIKDVERLIKENKLNSYNLEGHIRIKQSDVLEYIESSVNNG